ncbi:hypothetical protein [Kitasatospora sp. NPDC058190]|uniref:hypothetical protein n=1 Tax=Kitasatospora sp. NPDC058190 TaxID=3346371 RepID=UPI0036DC0C23
MSDVIVSVEAVEEVRPTELSTDALDEQLIGQLVDRARASGLQQVTAVRLGIAGGSRRSSLFQPSGKAVVMTHIRSPTMIRRTTYAGRRYI